MVPLLAMARETIAADFPGVEVKRSRSSFDVTRTGWRSTAISRLAGEFFELAVEFGWMTKEKLLADRAAFETERATRIEAGRKHHRRHHRVRFP